MSNKADIIEEITSLADNEISDSKRIEELNYLINSNESLQFEYTIQKRVKEAVSNKSVKVPAPESLRKSIFSSVFEEAQNEDVLYLNKPKAIKPSKGNYWDFLFTPQFAVSVIAVIAIIYFLSAPFNNPSINEILNGQSGRYNMFVQANNNFESIVKGELTLQYASSNPEEVKEFFKENGVQYESHVPLFQYWNLLGGVVSEDKGEKFAHHVYSGGQGELLYLYQVRENYIKDRHILDLSPDLISMLDSGEPVKYIKGEYCTYMWKYDNTIFALVSNENPELLENHFITALR